MSYIFVAPDSRFGGAAAGSSRQADPVKRLKGYPLLGVLPQLKGDQLRYFVDLADRHGDVIELPLGMDKVLMLNSPSAVEHVLQRNAGNYHKSRYYGPLKPILGDGIFLAEDEHWLHQRRSAVPGFQGIRLKQMTEQMCAATEEMMARWESGPEAPHRDEGAGLDLVPEMMGLALDIVLRSLLSYRLEGDDGARVMTALTTILREAERRVWSLVPLPLGVPTPRNLALKRSLGVLDDLVGRVVARRNETGERGEDLLQLLIDAQPDMAKAGMPDTLLRDQVLSTILAGHETTANALSWTFILLSRHPEILRKVQAEIADVLGGRAPAFEDLHDLVYTRQVFMEAMRLYPPVWTLSRQAMEDDELPGVPVPKGTTVMLCSYAVQRRRQFWPNPEGFDPDRFTAEEIKRRPRHAWFPFGGGPRKCLGERFAMMEALVVLSMVLQRYRLELAPGQSIVPEPMITLRPAGTVRMRLAAT